MRRSGRVGLRESRIKLLLFRRSPIHERTEGRVEVLGEQDGDPYDRLNALLAEVWQPFWLDKPDEMLDDPDSRYPGRELARERRRRAEAGRHG
jgi:hypothetical protein